MKINIKLTADQVFYLEKRLKSISKYTPAEYARLDRPNKNQHSLMIDCLDKLESKSKKIQRSDSIFDTKKMYALTLKYHEASILNTLAATLEPTEGFASHYRGLCTAIRLIIDKQL